MGKIGFYWMGYFIAYYGAMIVTGILVNIPIAYIQTKRFHIPMNDLIIICSISGLFAAIGAKILYLITFFRSIDFSKLSDLSYINSLMTGGFVFFGGIGGVLLAIIFCKRKLDIPIQPYIQACIGCLPIGHAFGRIGCFLVGCCYGIPYTGRLSVVYTESLFAPCGVGLFPVQLAEAAFELILGTLLLVLSSKLTRYNGLLVYLIVYSVFRFFIEFLRYDDVRGQIVYLSTSQLLCIILLTITSFFLARSSYSHIKYKK